MKMNRLIVSRCLGLAQSSITNSRLMFQFWPSHKTLDYFGIDKEHSYDGYERYVQDQTVARSLFDSAQLVLQRSRCGGIRTTSLMVCQSI
jgi:hypothetical protein